MLLAVGIAVAVAVLAVLVERRRPQPPSQRRWAVPDQVDRNDFDRPGAPWLVAVFSSACLIAMMYRVNRFSGIYNQRYVTAIRAVCGSLG